MLNFNMKAKSNASGSQKKKQKVIGQLRRTQLVTTFGIGAIVDMPECSAIMAAADYWNRYSPTLVEPSLQKLLNVNGFKLPYVSGDSDHTKKPDIPAFRFPIWHFCPSCGSLKPYWEFDDKDGILCHRCNKIIIPSRFVAACINGHLEDFPYKWWVHKGHLDDCPAKDRDDCLKVTFSDKTGGLEGIVITCTACGKSRSMAGSMSKGALIGYKCHGHRPWIGMKSEYNDPVDCEAEMRGLQRGASNVYFSQTVSALTIPPWSTEINQEIGKHWKEIAELENKGVSDDLLEIMVRALFKDFLEKHQDDGTVLARVMGGIKQYQKQNSTNNYTIKDLYEDEYQTFCLGDYEQVEDTQFKIERAEVPDFLNGYIKDVIMVKRLREVLALKGFRRITPEKPDFNNPEFKGYHLGETNDLVPLSKNKLDWLPAIEMLGEGIFIRLDDERLKEWESRNDGYYSAMAARLAKSNVGCPNFSSRYVLLHTLSHLLIRQLSMECGYSGAAIKERIYSTYPDSEIEMAGILLYTSSSDSDGSLGGLVRNALPKPFENIVRNMLQEASWCSSDPVCIESKAQGFDSLNYAACHACTLLPETSCEMRNCLLDRGAVVGSIEDRKQGFFGDLF